MRPAIDDLGRVVAFQGTARNLVPDDTNGLDDIFVRDRLGIARLSAPPGLAIPR